MARQIDGCIDRSGFSGGTGGVASAAAGSQMFGENVGETGTWNGPRPARVGRGRGDTSRSPGGTTTPCGRMVVQRCVLAMGMTMTGAPR